MSLRINITNWFWRALGLNFPATNRSNTRSILLSSTSHQTASGVHVCTNSLTILLQSIYTSHNQESPLNIESEIMLKFCVINSYRVQRYWNWLCQSQLTTGFLEMIGKFVAWEGVRPVQAEQAPRVCQRCGQSAHMSRYPPVLINCAVAINNKQAGMRSQ